MQKKQQQQQQPLNVHPTHVCHLDQDGQVTTGNKENRKKHRHEQIAQKRRQETWNPNDLYEQNGFDNSICIAHFELQMFSRGASRQKKKQPAANDWISGGIVLHNCRVFPPQNAQKWNGFRYVIFFQKSLFLLSLLCHSVLLHWSA